MEIPQMTPHGFCVWGIPFQGGGRSDATLVQIHESAFFKWHHSLGEMQKKCRWRTQKRTKGLTERKHVLI